MQQSNGIPLKCEFNYHRNLAVSSLHEANCLTEVICYLDPNIDRIYEIGDTRMQDIIINDKTVFTAVELQNTTLMRSIIQEEWAKVFPDSCIQVNRGVFGESLYIKGHLAKDKSEVFAGIMMNDPLVYHAVIDVETGANYKEGALSLYVQPAEDSYNAFDSVKIRKKSIKKLSRAKLRARFEQIKQMVIDNKDNLKDVYFDINTKL